MQWLIGFRNWFGVGGMGLSSSLERRRRLRGLEMDAYMEPSPPATSGRQLKLCRSHRAWHTAQIEFTNLTSNPSFTCKRWSFLEEVYSGHFPLSPLGRVFLPRVTMLVSQARLLQPNACRTASEIPFPHNFLPSAREILCPIALVTFWKQQPDNQAYYAQRLARCTEEKKK